MNKHSRIHERILNPRLKAERDSLYIALQTIVDKYGSLPIRERSFVVKLVQKKLTEREKEGNKHEETNNS